MDTRNKYTITLEWSDEDEAWIMSIAQMPGLKADGGTVLEAFHALLTNANEYLKELKRLNRSKELKEHWYKLMEILDFNSYARVIEWVI